MVEPKTQGNTLADVMTEALIGVLADTVAEVEAETLYETLSNMKAETLVKTLADTLAKKRRKRWQTRYNQFQKDLRHCT